MKNIAVMGYGVVGSGVVEVFYKNKSSIEKKIGCEMDIKYILEKRKIENRPYLEKITGNFEDIINDDDIDVVVEVMGGINPAYDFVKRCLQSGKSVVTSNKELVAKKGAELLKIAKEKDVNFLFEASVGGGIPIIRPLHQCLAGNEIDEIDGILNGTTNFILTKMIKEKMSFKDALKMAQELGYAEKDPTADVEGIDACRKICILASLAFGRHIYPEHVTCEGISKLTLDDVACAKKCGGVIKLIGSCKRRDDNKVFVTVAPFVVPKESQISTVDDVFNGIVVKGDAIGEVMFYGKGAGKLPTASAVVGDVIDCIKATGTIKTLQWDDCKENIVSDYKEEKFAMMIRVKNINDIKEKIEKEFSSPEFALTDNKNEIVFVTEKMSTYNMEKLISNINAEVISAIKILAE